MSLPTKGARKITVDGEAYRWSIRKKPTYDQAAFTFPMTFAVESIRDPKRTLVVTTTLPRPDNWLHKPSAAVTPAKVAEAIRQARRNGWQPGVPGSAFMLEFDIAGSNKTDATGPL